MSCRFVPASATTSGAFTAVDSSGVVISVQTYDQIGKTYNQLYTDYNGDLTYVPNGITTIGVWEVAAPLPVCPSGDDIIYVDGADFDFVDGTEFTFIS